MIRLAASIPMQFLVVGLSVLLHAGVVGLSFVQWPFGKELHVRLDRPMVYHVDLVILAPPAPGRPPPKPEVKIPAQPQKAPAPPKPAPAPKKEPAPVPPKKAVPVPAPVAAPAPPPPKPEVKIPAQPQKAPAPPKPAPAPKKEPAPAPPKKAEPTRDQILAEALGSVRKDVAQRSTDEREQALAGLRQDAATGTGGAEGAPGGVAAGGLVEIYAQMVESRIKAHWRFPQIASRPDLSATIEITLGLDGQVQATRVVRSSGRPDFDASTERAVEEAGQLPPPPRPDLRTLRITFNLQEL